MNSAYYNYYKKLYCEKNLNFFDLVVLKILSLFSCLYLLIIKIRDYLYEFKILNTSKINIPVISIGNISVGGTGKTSVVITLTKLLQNREKEIAVLSRGYKSEYEHNLGVVSDGKNILLKQNEAGDEPYLLALKLPGIKVIVGKNRANSASYAINKFKTNLIILDDGFQQKKLFNNINIILIDAKDPFGNYKIFPRGGLRQPLKVLSKGDIFIITNINLIDSYKSIADKIREFNQKAKIFTSEYQLTNIKKITNGELIKKEDISNKEILLVTGIAHPEYFEQTVENYLNKKCKNLFYPDHYNFKEEDFLNIQKKAKEFNCEIILITEKDAVKFKVLEIPVYIVEVEMKINNEKEFVENINELITLHRIWICKINIEVC